MTSSPPPSGKKAKDVSLEAFWKLSSEKEEARLEAAVKLLKNLKVGYRIVYLHPFFSDTHVFQSSDEDQFSYVVGRLVRGLGSSQVSARQGFFVALVELLRRRKGEERVAEEVLGLLKEHLQHSGSKSVSIPSTQHITLMIDE